jgi:hypothetical protein
LQVLWHGGDVIRRQRDALVAILGIVGVFAAVGGEYGFAVLLGGSAVAVILITRRNDRAADRSRRAAARQAVIDHEAAMLAQARLVIRINRQADVLEQVVTAAECSNCGAPPVSSGQACRYCGQVTA